MTFSFVLVGNINGSISAYFLNKEDCMRYRQFEIGNVYVNYQNANYAIIDVISIYKLEHCWQNYYTLQRMSNKDEVLANVSEHKLLQHEPRSFAFTDYLIPVSSIGRAK
jgi:hypothetical protein